MFLQDDMTNTDFVCNGMDDLALFDVPDSITNPTVNDVALPEPVSTYINTLDPSQISNSYGYDLFQHAIQLLQE